MTDWAIAANGDLLILAYRDGRQWRSTDRGATWALAEPDRGRVVPAPIHEAAEDASSEGVPIEDAIQAVRDGYASAAADREFREDP